VAVADRVRVCLQGLYRVPGWPTFFRLTAWTSRHTEARPPSWDQDQEAAPATPELLGARWPAEHPNAWLCSFVQLRRRTDRVHSRRDAWIEFATTLILTTNQRAGAPPIDPVSNDWSGL
jgi:hypothetical protein